MTSSKSQYSVSWDSFQSNVCLGFSAFQQNGEFVDMTIAADNHVVKVHKVLIALASPYLREIICSTPANQHPIIYLNNVDNKTLCELLEYIYTGEVMVPIDNLTKFLEIGKSLNIRGLENVVDSKIKMFSSASSQQEDITKGLRPLVVKARCFNEKITTPVSVKNVQLLTASTANISTPTSTDNDNIIYEIDTTFDDTLPEINYTDDNPQQQLSQSPDKSSSGRRRQIDSSIQFTVSTRGSLQMILNRYLYNVHFKSQKNNSRRWRCVEYRDNRCPAFVITKGSTVVSRYHPHNHAFHDKKILMKLEKNSVYSAIEDIDELNGSEQDGTTTELDQSN